MSFPFDLHSAAVFDSHLPCRAHAALRPCRSSQGHGTVPPSRDGLWATCPISASLAITRSSREVVIRSILISVAGGQRETKHEEKLIFVQGHECLYNLQHKDYDNSLVTGNCWTEIAEVHAQGKKQATQYFVHYRKSLLLVCVCVILVR